MIRRSNYSIFLSSYSVGKECYKEIPYVTRKYGKKAVATGGKTAMAKATSVIEWQFIPGASAEKFKDAILQTDEDGKNYLANL